jgi:hypothetical protein
MDHLEGAVYRDYSTAPRSQKRRSVITDNLDKKAESQAKKETEGTAQNSELMAETLKRLYTDEPTAEPTVTVDPDATIVDATVDAGQETKRMPAVKDETGTGSTPRRRVRKD